MVDARSRYLKKMHTPTPFSQGPEMQNYTQMMNLQNQASNFAPNDPRIQELKDRRRTYNRFDKYKIGDKFNVAPLDVQKDFSNRSNDFRNVAPNVYGKMYPLQDMAMRYGQSGGLLGLMAKEMFGKVSDFGKSMVNREGIAGAADTDEGEMEDYAAQTFGMGAPIDRHPGSTPVIEGPMEQSEVIYSPHGPTYYDRAEGLDFDTDPDQPYVAPDDYVEDDFGAFADTFMPIERDSNRERAIANQYATNFIGPRDDPHRRPDMYDVAGPGINRGLIPYPEYNDNMVYTPQMGRGDLPRYGYDYAGERQAREEEYRLQQLLDSILNQEEEQVPPPLSIGASR